MVGCYVPSTHHDRIGSTKNHARFPKARRVGKQSIRQRGFKFRHGDVYGSRIQPGVSQAQGRIFCLELLTHIK